MIVIQYIIPIVSVRSVHSINSIQGTFALEAISFTSGNSDLPCLRRLRPNDLRFVSIRNTKEGSSPNPDDGSQGLRKRSIQGSSLTQLEAPWHHGPYSPGLSRVPNTKHIGHRFIISASRCLRWCTVGCPWGLWRVEDHGGTDGNGSCVHRLHDLKAFGTCQFCSSVNHV